MPPNGDTHFALPEMGGLEHPPQCIPSHLQLGAASVDLLQNTLRMRLFTRWEEGLIKVTVALTNTGAGHHVPTDFPGRNLILTVTACSKGGAPLTQVEAPGIPDWGGDLAGLPGKGFAKILTDVMTGEKPVISYWKQTLVDKDNRIAANETDVSAYTFEAPLEEVEVTVTAEVHFRRLFPVMMADREWQIPPILMEKQQTNVFTRRAD